MFVAVVTWTAGFDILYACQDYDSDLATGTFSVPSKFGIAGALWVSRATHVVSAAAIIALGVFVPDFGLLYAIGAGVAVLLLIVEQLLVNPKNLSRINLAFFAINGLISLLLGTLGIFDIYLH
jgi:4-hydroxybenzoate polyprenyltransferase